MPEGHSVHRIARQFALHFVGQSVTASSPQGRFAAGAAQISGMRMTDARAVGKQMFLEFDERLWLRVHLGMYGAWDFAGDITADATTASANGRMGQTNQRGTVVGAESGAAPVSPAPASAAPASPAAGQNGENEDSLHSIGAPRRTRLRMSESEKLGMPLETFPPEPIGAVRVRLRTEGAVADLRGPTACEVLHPEEVQAVIAKLGPDPLLDDAGDGEDRFVTAVRKKQTPIGLILMDQAVVSGIGNVYRAELLFRARLNPHTPGKLVTDDLARALWKDWSYLLELGVRTGQMMTMDDLDDEGYTRALANRDDRHWVYHRAGKPCRVCGTDIVMELAAARKLYYCPHCQA
ncbi:endonuclease-8/formamidopyrimidine-DNA glycosylase [Glaciihabitans tibetensis]|uniref:DNA-(apurinic or apyrimidinic site) lyase n=1 Tax=Glaciihabitans tibetensis TaxID=1266600 RepID=A0A2T0VIP8_9MICO|nr:DNA-formamidopyrimidine glycosylase family protein [Glaciihabitans tibetensis]PRY70088.1 endonuclease-8/formamidopyrimidine-DNA glycosylase [Glaciihabitans tibetensis]